MSVRAVAEVGPEAVESPGFGGDELTAGLEACVGVPELGGQEKATVSFGAATVDEVGLGAGGAGEERGFNDAGVIEVGLVVE